MWEAQIFEEQISTAHQKNKKKKRKEKGEGVKVRFVLMHPYRFESADVPAVRLVVDVEAGGGVAGYI